MHNRPDILNHLRAVMSELFEVDPQAVKPEARLYEDLDIDSIDAADLMVSLCDYTGSRVEPQAFKSVRTVAETVGVVQALLRQ